MSKKIQEIEAESIWNIDSRRDLKAFIAEHSKIQTAERKFRNSMLSIQYEIEDYIGGEITHSKLLPLDFIKKYLKLMKLSQKKFAEFIEIENSNLHKYLTGERKLNSNLVVKISTFTHTKPAHWLGIENRNELNEIEKEWNNKKKYKKYDFTTLVVTSKREGVAKLPY